MSAEHKRPLYAFLLVSALCVFLVGAAVVRGNALSLTFHPSVPLAAPQADQPAADLPAEVPSAPAAVSLPEALSIRPAVGPAATTRAQKTDRTEPEAPAHKAVKMSVKEQRKAAKTAAKKQRKVARTVAKNQRKIR